MAKKSERGTRPIITGFLEKIGAKVFVDYRNVITELIKGRQGIYALYKNDRLYYVGLATDLRRRIKAHTDNKNKGKWTHFSLYIVRKADHIRELESLVLRIADPKGNRIRGKLSSSKNLRRLLKRKLKQEWERQVIDIIGGKRSVAIAKKKLPTRDKPLKGFFPGGKRIYATYKGKGYKAWVYGGGSISLSGKLYDSPSMAGIAVTKKKTINGWKFWKYKDKNGKLVYIDKLRSKGCK